MKNFLVIGFLLVILFTIPITLFLVRNQTQNRSNASPATQLSFIPPTKTVSVGDNFTLDLNINPGEGSSANSVAFVDLSVTYPKNLDVQKLPENDNTGIKIGQVNGNAIVKLTEPKIDCVSQTCTLKVSLGMPPGYPITGSQPIATLYFTAVSATDPNSSGAEISLDNSKALSTAINDKPSDNILSSKQSAVITINGQTTPTPTDTSGSGQTTPTPTDSGSGGTGGGGGGSSNGPTCTSLSADKTSATAAPASVTFTVVGNSSSTTISKVTLNFGDGNVQDVTTGGGIGTNAVNAQQAHVYSQTGTFTASATLTDASGGTSAPSSCSQTIMVGTTPTTTPTPTQAAPIPSTGPGQTILAVGAVGTAIILVGGLFLFGL